MPHQTPIDEIEAIEEFTHPNLGRFGIGYQGQDIVEFQVTANGMIASPMTLAESAQWAESFGFISSRIGGTVQQGPAWPKWLREMRKISLPRISVNEPEAWAMLGLDNRKPGAARAAFYRFRARYRIPTLPGGVYSIKKLQEAADTN